MRKSTLAFGTGALFAVLAGVIGAVVLTRASNTETVVVSTHTIFPYTRIQSRDVTTVTVPKTSGIAGLATSKKSVVGQYLSFAVPKGDPITAADLNPSGGSFSTFLTQYTERTGQTGMLMALPVQSTLASVVNPGESIALIIPQQNGESQSLTTLEPVPVLNVLTKQKGGTPTALLIFVTEKDYRVLAPAILNNNVQVGLIPQNGSFKAPTSISLTSPTPSQATGTAATPTVTSSPPTDVNAQGGKP
ncbi:SAF domain-containing protein [Alicyclobacillus fodiniaquatilis]|uniref:SAF domain-containing protein n=1 Tax=Alicyclobacillus fodiniaquatilis TaxID=1661150 RepID=A0ABW4JEJ9_9BACL